MDVATTLRRCLRDAIPEIAEAARYLDEAVSAHLVGRGDLATELIRRADIPAVRDWTESLWGKNSPYVKVRSFAPSSNADHAGSRARMPSAAEKAQLRARDGYHCRFCGIPLIRAEVRRIVRDVYPEALQWGTRARDCHAAFQAMWLQYDHVVPFKRGGGGDVSNLVITCAPCNFSRMNYTLEEVGLFDPREFAPIQSQWDGLERVRR